MDVILDRRGVDVVLKVDGGDAEDRRRRRGVYLAQARELVETYEGRLKDKRWTPVPYGGDKRITCYEFEAGAEDGYNLKAECIIEGKTADSIATAHRNHQAIPRRSWDGDDIHDIGLLETVREQDISPDLRMEVNVQFAEHKPVVPGIAVREFVYIEASLRERSTTNPDDHKWIILTRETDHPARPVRSDPVRAFSRTIMILTPLPPKGDSDGLLIPSTSVTLVAFKVSPGGYITPAVIKLYKTKLADRLAFLKKTMFV